LKPKGLGGILLLVWTLRAVQGAEPNVLLDRCIAAQTNLHTWSADLTQTRTLQVMEQPLVATGRVWMVLPDRFRWELGRPPQSIAVRQPNELSLIYPRLKRVEKFAIDPNQAGPWKEIMSMLDATFPRSREELASHFNVQLLTQTNDLIHLVLQPKSSFARKLMTEIQIDFSTTNFCPISTELKFSDGSSMRNDFFHSVVNAPLPEGIFDLKLEPGFTVVYPLRQ